MLANNFDACVRKRWYQPLEYEYMIGCAWQSMNDCDTWLLCSLHDREMLRSLLRSSCPDIALDWHLDQMRLAGFFADDVWSVALYRTFFER